MPSFGRYVEKGLINAVLREKVGLNLAYNSTEQVYGHPLSSGPLLSPTGDQDEAMVSLRNLQIV